jgi:opacity protein-like surface antigen
MKLVSGPCAATLLLLASALSQGALAEEEWEFEVTPYLFAAALNGTTGVDGVETDIDVPFSEIWDNLDSAFMALFTARKNRWLYGLEGVYMDLDPDTSGSVTGPLGNVTISGALDVTTKMYVYQGTVGYAVLQGETSVDLIAAARYTKLDVGADLDITLAGPVRFAEGSLSGSGSESWTDLVVGAQVLHAVSENVNLMGYVDFGGGGGSGSDSTYQAIAGVNWEFSENYIAKFGYRYLKWDYDQDGFKWDVAASGAYAGLGIRF